MFFKIIFRSVFLVTLLSLVSITSLMAAESNTGKIGVMNIQKVLVESDSGREAKAFFEEKGKELDQRYAADKAAIYDLGDEIKKKSSVWSKEVRDQKVFEYNQKGQELQARVDDEMKALQDSQLNPILKALETLVEDYGKKNGFAVILDSKNGVVFYDKAVDISDNLIAELNKILK